MNISKNSGVFTRPMKLPKTAMRVLRGGAVAS